MKQLHIRNSIILNIFQEASEIQRDFDRFMIHEKGAYLKGAEKPILKQGKQYYVLHSSGASTPLRPGEEIKGTVVDEVGRIVLTLGQVPLLRAEPTIPVVGLKVVTAFVEYVLKDLCVWEGKNGHGDLGNYLRPFFQRSITDPAPNVVPEVKYADIVSRIMATCSTLRGVIRSQLFEEEGSEYRMCLASRTGRDIAITQHEDYRVTEYERMQSSGEVAFLKQFLSTPDGEKAFAVWLEHDKAFNDWKKSHDQDLQLNPPKVVLKEPGKGRVAAKVRT